MSAAELHVNEFEEDIETKPMNRGERLVRSEAARLRRKARKNIVEKRVTNEWARIHRLKKKK